MGGVAHWRLARYDESAVTAGYPQPRPNGKSGTLETGHHDTAAAHAKCAPQAAHRRGRVQFSAALKHLLAFCLYRVPLVHTAVAKVLYLAQFQLLRFYQDPDTVRLLRSVYAERACLVQPLEAQLIYSIAQMQALLEGSMAEVGTHEGATAKLICHAKQGRLFFGFDTFEGLPEPGREDTSYGQPFFRLGKYAATYDNVKGYLASFDGVQIVKGVFPASGQCIETARFSFVHLDVDLYRGTKDALDFFWPRLVDRGIIAVHDSHTGGVARAIREFTAAEAPLSFRSFGSHMIFIKHAGPPVRHATAALNDSP
jgi:O-methyltransferase